MLDTVDSIGLKYPKFVVYKQATVYVFAPSQIVLFARLCLCTTAGYGYMDLLLFIKNRSWYIHGKRCL